MNNFLQNKPNSNPNKPNLVRRSPGEAGNYEQRTMNYELFYPNQTQPVVSMPALPALSLSKGARSKCRTYLKPVSHFYLFYCSDAQMLCWPKANRSRRDSETTSGSPLRCVSNPLSAAAAHHGRSHPSHQGSLPTGAGGIRTPGTFRYNGFQDRRLKPLGHCSMSLLTTLYNLFGNQNI